MLYSKTNTDNDLPNLSNLLIFRLLPILLAGIGLSGIALGQTNSLPANPDSALVTALSRIEGDPLRLSDVLDRALTQSAQVHDAKGALAAARGALRRERGTFDPELYADLSKSSEQQPSASPFTGAAVLKPKTTAGEAGARVTLPTGTELQASVVGTKLETNSAYASLNPQYNATGNLTVRQPLLQGFGPATWGSYSQAQRNYEAAKQRYEDAVAGVRTLAESVYWNLYAGARDLAVARLTAERAAAFLNEVETRANAGLVGPNQVNSAKAFQAEQELVLLDAEENLSRISDDLAVLIGERAEGTFMRYRTTDEPPLQYALEPEDSVVARALRSNHQLIAAEWDVKSMQALARAAWWNALPRLDVFGALGGNGLSGTGRDVIFGSDTLHNSRDDRFADALDQALHRDYPTWTIGLNLTIPILLREKGGERDRVKAELSRAEWRYIQLKRTLEEQVRISYRELAHGQDRERAAKVGVEASVNQVRIGLIEYENGRTTAFELVRLGADLANAQRRYSQALVRTAKAMARLRQLAPESSESE